MPASGTSRALSRLNRHNVAVTLALIPLPQSVEVLAHAGSSADPFVLGPHTAITASDPAARAVAGLLVERLRDVTGFALPLLDASAAGAPSIEFDLDDTVAGGAEAYTLEVAAEAVRLRAATAEGLFRGSQTLRQLLPAAVEGSGTQAGGTRADETWRVPAVRIADAPRYGYRGAMLDVVRHFFDVAAVKRFIDALAAYKLNVLHLHLSDDQGWRIEMPSRPGLTAQASHYQVGDGERGGFYTRADWDEIVAYAAERYVTVVPEIDVPGHTNAALSVYPEIRPDWFTPVVPYTDTEVGFSSLAPEKEATYEFLADVFADLAAMTPGSWLHIGGDEVDKLQPEEFDRFVRRAAEIAAATGKTVIGWEEVAKTGVPTTVVAQYWGRGAGHEAAGETSEHGSEDEFRAAMRNGTKVVVSPATRSYLDMAYQPGYAYGTDWAGFVPARAAYEWDPASYFGADVPADGILGVEACLWTETVATMAEAEHLIFPRLPGLAEIGWSAADAAGRDWQGYRPRIAAHAARWEAAGRSYFRAPEIWG